MPALEKDYYQILGIPRDTDEQAIKKAYHTLAMQWHPDRNKSPEAGDRFKEIATAYAILKDPQKRLRYDTQGMEGVAHYSAEDLFGNLDLGHIFDKMGFAFGGDSIFDCMYSHRSSRPPHGQDLRVPIEIPLEMINDGGRQKLQVSHPVACASCHGYGTKPGTPPALCNSCHGSGRIISTHNETKGEEEIKVEQIKVCPICHGKGTEITDPCPICGGYGQIEKEETIEVTIPPGIEDGVILRVAGQGLLAEEADIPPGDLHIVISTKTDNRYQRRGPDLWRAETLTVPDAVLGTKISIPGLGENIELTIPPGTQADEIIQLKAKGLPPFSGERTWRYQYPYPAGYP